MRGGRKEERQLCRDREKRETDKQTETQADRLYRIYALTKQHYSTDFPASTQPHISLATQPLHCSINQRRL